MKTLVLNASIRSNDSITRTLSQQLVDQLKAKGSHIVHRNLSDLPFITEASFTAAGTPKNERTAAQVEQAKLSDELIEEIQAADILVIGSPVYNFGPAASLKAWADLVARAGTTFRYTNTGPQGLLENKKAYILAASGGTAMGSSIDFMSTWLKHFLGFLGIKDIELIAVDVNSKDGDAKLAEAQETIKTLI